MVSLSRPWTSVRSAQALRLAGQDRLVLAAAVVIGAALRLVGLDRHSFWTDELYVLWESRQPLDVLFDPQIHIHHPPGYRLVLQLWGSISQSEAWLRLLPALAGLLLVPVVWLLARELWPGKVGVAGAAALLVATSPWMLHYSHDVTTYSWSTLWVTGSFLLLLLAWRADRWWLWAAWSISLAGSLYSHYFSLFPLAAEAVVLVVLAFFAPRGYWKSRGEIEDAGDSSSRAAQRRLAHAVLAVLGSMALYAPWAYVLLSGGGESLTFFFFPLTLDNQPVVWIAIMLVGYANALFWQHGAGVTWAWVIIGIAASWGAWRLARAWSIAKAAPLTIVALWGFAATAGPYAFLRLSTPPEAVDPVRFAALAVPALLLGLAASLASAPLPVRTLALAGWVALAGVQWRDELVAPAKQDWRAMLTTVAANAQPGDALLAFPVRHAAAGAAYYKVPMPAKGGWIIPGKDAASDVAYWHPPEWEYRGFYNLEAYKSTDWRREVAARTQGATRVWYLAGDSGPDGTYSRSFALEQTFAESGWKMAGEWRASPLVLQLYTVGDGSP